jgi:heme exporter protein D
MNWASASDFLAMGGSGFYVWGSFLVTAACLATEPLLLRSRRRQALARVRSEKARSEAAA